MNNNILKFGVLGGAAMLGFFGCGESTSFEGETAIPITELPPKYAAALCQSYSTCAGPLLDVYLGGADCTTNLRRTLEDELTVIQEAVTAGTAKYDGTKLQACVDKIASLGCDAIYQRDIDVCVATLHGTLATGSMCTMDFECASGNFCKSNQACPGTCTARQAAGATCDKDDQCASGLSCKLHKCEAPGGVGAVCGGANDPECRTGLTCVGKDAQTKTPGLCKENAEVFAGNVGDVCDIQAAKFCKAGSVCSILSASVTGLVSKCTAPVASGAACKASLPSQCPLDEYCKLQGKLALGMVDGTCTKKPANGEPCGEDLFGTVCAPYTTCDKMNKCVTVERAGGACSDANSCYSDTCTGGKCVAGGKCN